MPRIPSYSDEGIQLNAPIAEGSGFRRSPDLTVDFEAQRNQKLFAGITEVAGALAVREQAMRNNMEYNDKLNKFMLEAQDKRTELLNRKGTNALHYDPTEDNPDGQMSVTEDYDAWYKQAYAKLIGGTKNSVIREKLKGRVGELNVQYTGDILNHELKTQEEVTINSNNALASNYLNLAKMHILSGNENAFKADMANYNEITATSNAFSGKSKEEADYLKTTAMNDFWTQTINELKSKNPQLAANILSRHRADMSGDTYMNLSGTLTTAMKSSHIDEIIRAGIKAHPEWVRRDGNLNISAVRDYYLSHPEEFNMTVGGGADDFESYIQATIEHESSGDPNAWNEKGQAWGKYQYTEGRWYEEAKRAGVKANWREATEAEQDAVYRAELKHLWERFDGDKYAMAVAHYGSEELGAKWHEETLRGGDHSGAFWTDKQINNGVAYPSIKEYAEEQVRKLGGAGAGGYTLKVTNDEISERINAISAQYQMDSQQLRYDSSNTWAEMERGFESVDQVYSSADALQAQYHFDEQTKNAFIRSGLSWLSSKKNIQNLEDATARKESYNNMKDLIYRHLINGDTLPYGAQLMFYGVTNHDDVIQYEQYRLNEEKAKSMRFDTHWLDNNKTLIDAIVLKNTRDSTDKAEIALERARAYDTVYRKYVESNGTLNYEDVNRIVNDMAKETGVVKTSGIFSDTMAKGFELPVDAVER